VEGGRGGKGRAERESEESKKGWRAGRWVRARLNPTGEATREGTGRGTARGWCTSPPFFGKSRHICQIFVPEQNLADRSWARASERASERERERERTRIAGSEGTRRLKWIGFVRLYGACTCVYSTTNALISSLAPETSPPSPPISGQTCQLLREIIASNVTR